MNVFSRLLVMAALLSAVTLAPATPAIQHWQTTNGVKVYFVAAPEIPILDIRLVYHAGSARDGEHQGIAKLTSSLMDDGAGDYDANAFNDRLADTGAIFKAGSLKDMAWLSMRTLGDEQYRKPAFELLKAVAAAPRFDADAVARSKTATITKIKRDQSSPGKLADKAIRRAIFGDHPYGHPSDGTEQSIAAITRDDVVAFHRRYYVSENAVLAMVGALSEQQAKQLAEELSAVLPSGKPPRPLPTVEPLAESVEQHIEFSSIQSHVRVGQPGMKRGDPDYFPLLVGNHVLGGGGLVSLLFDEVREKRGLSYSVNSYFTPMAELGPFIASLQTDGTQAAEALDVLHQTIADFIENGPPPERLQAAKQNLIGGFPLRIDSNSKILEYIAMIGFYQLPLDYLEQFPNKVAAVDAKAVQSAFARRVGGNKLATVVVGKKP